MIQKCFWLSLGLALLFVILRGLLVLTTLPGGILWILLLIALITGLISASKRNFE